MRLYDRFGPLTRAAIAFDTTKDFDVAALWRKFNRPFVFAGRLRDPDLSEPAIDAKIAQFVRDQVAKHFGLSHVGPVSEKPRSSFALTGRPRRGRQDAITRFLEHQRRRRMAGRSD